MFEHDDHRQAVSLSSLQVGAEPPFHPQQYSGLQCENSYSKEMCVETFHFLPLMHCLADPHLRVTSLMISFQCS